jgi:hypothetical protein
LKQVTGFSSGLTDSNSESSGLSKSFYKLFLEREIAGKCPIDLLVFVEFQERRQPISIQDGNFIPTASACPTSLSPAYSAATPRVPPTTSDIDSQQTR